jgi:hypothetical protein
MAQGRSWLAVKPGFAERRGYALAVFVTGDGER